MKIVPENIPAELRERHQWVLWRYESRTNDPDVKPTKVPYQPRGFKAATTNPRHWSLFDDVMEVWRTKRIPCEGIGFVFTAGDPYCGIDLDHVWQSDADEGSAWGWEILEHFADTYVEASPSDRGMKIWCKAKAPRCGAWKLQNGAIEIYDHARYFAVTGRSNGIRVVNDHEAHVESLITCVGGSGRRSTVGRVDRRIPYGSQHHTLVSLAGTMRRRGMTGEAIEAALLVVNSQQCERPGPIENIRRIAQDAARWLR